MSGATSTAPEPLDDLRVVTYNIRKGKGASGRDQVTMASVAEWLEEHGPDLLLCQEVFHCARTGDSQSRGLAGALGLSSYYGANKFRAVGHHGNTTLTSLEVEMMENHDISTNTIERRGALYLRLRLGRTPLHVVNVHLGLNERQRRLQVEKIARLLEERAHDAEPVLLAGDFNDWRKRLDPMIVGELGFENALGNTAASHPTWHARRPVFSLDRIYIKNLDVAEVRRLDGQPWNQLSDHLPLFARITL